MNDCRDGDTDAIAHIYNEYYKDMLAGACRIVRNRANAEDVVNNTIIRIINAARRLKGDSDVKEPAKYIFRTVYNAAKDYAKSENRQKFDNIDDFAATLGIDPLKIPMEEIIVYDLLKDLDDRSFMIVAAKINDNARFQDIADELHKSKSYVSSRFYRALKKIVHTNPDLRKYFNKSPEKPEKE